MDKQRELQQTWSLKTTESEQDSGRVNNTAQLIGTRLALIKYALEMDY